MKELPYQNQELATEYQVRGVPAKILLKNGNQRLRQSGVLSKDDIIKMLLKTVICKK